jgi:hypothetical protein
MTPVSRGVGVVGGNAAATSSGNVLKGGNIHVSWLKGLLPVSQTWVYQ